MDIKNKKNIVRVLGVLLLIVGIVFIVEREKNPGAPTSTNPVPGSPAGANTVGVPIVDPESVSKVIKDAKTGQEYVSNQLIVEFNTGVSEQESLSVIEGVGGTMMQRFTLAPLFLIQVKDAGDGKGAASAMAKLSANPKVKKADFNYLTTVKDVPAAPAQ